MMTTSDGRSVTRRSAAARDLLPGPLVRVLDSVAHTPLGRPLAFFFRLGFVFLRALQNDRAFIRAAGMAYGTLITLVPLLVLIFGTLGALGLFTDPDQQRIVLDAFFGTFFGNVTEIREAMTPFLQSIDFGALGLISTGALLVVSARLYLTVERAYNDIFQVPIDRWFTARLLNFYFTLTMIPLIVVLSIEGLGESGLGIASPFLVDGLKFVLLLGAIKLLPCVTVRWGPALVGAGTSWFLLTIGGKVFSWYLAFSYSNPDYPLRAFYGSLILVPIFLVWLYLLWVVVLLGVEIAHVAQNHRGLLDAELQAVERERGLRVLGLANALEVMANVARRFQVGDGPVDAVELSQQTGLNGFDVQQITQLYVGAGLLIHSESGWTLARPASRIDLAELQSIWRAETGVEGVRQGLQDAVERPLEGSLAEAVERWWT